MRLVIYLFEIMMAARALIAGVGVHHYRRFNVPIDLPILDLTILLFIGDPYMREFDATVVRAEGNLVVLDGTCFFPRGGCQQDSRARWTVHRGPRQ
jgi:hypothetical protein